MHRTFIKIVGLTLMLSLVFSFSSMAQRISDPVCIAKGSCQDVYIELKKYHESDSVAIKLLIENYIIEDQITFNSKQWKNAIEYINKEENKDLQCTLRSHVLRKSLLIKEKK
ncbi:MAG TPA: hypothetical protein VK982_05165 [Bacteroidales bacterium]|nr:hypothetical protein [Bacteroidales bacterium]